MTQLRGVCLAKQHVDIETHWGWGPGVDSMVVVVVVGALVHPYAARQTPHQPPASPKTKAPDGRKATGLPRPSPFAPPPSTFVWRPVPLFAEERPPNGLTLCIPASFVLNSQI